jgi:hypothetical protein
MPLQRCQGGATRWRPRRTALIYWPITSRPIKSQRPSERPDGTSRQRNLTRRKAYNTLQSQVHECYGRFVWPTRHASIADISEMDLIDETRRVAITSPGASAFLDASARYHSMNSGVFTLAIARRLGVALFPPQALCAACDAPMDSRGDRALSFCNGGPVSRGHRHGSLMYALSGTLRDANLRSERLGTPLD